MKKIALVVSLLFIGSALADSVPTSVGYVDSQIDTLQNKISAVDTNTVLTTTNTAGEIGQKSIYDATGNYASQTNALVTAEVANAAVQNAIDTEFVCIEWLGDEHIDANCLIWQLGAVNYAQYDLVGNLRNGQIFSNNAFSTVTFDSETKIATILCQKGYDSGNAGFWSVVDSDNNNYIREHKYYFRALMRTTVPGVKVGIGRSVKKEIRMPVGVEWSVHDAIFVANAPENSTRFYPVLRSEYPGGGEGVMIDQNVFSVYDLTNIFGAGNEPATADAAAKALHLLFVPFNE